MKMYLAIMKDTQGVPDFFHPSELMGNSADQVRALLSEDTPIEYIQGVYSPEDYLKIIQTPKFAKTVASFSPGMPEPAIKKMIGNLMEYVNSFITPQQVQPQIDMAQIAGITGGGDLPQEENFDYDEHTAPAPEYVINPHPSNVRDGNVTTNSFGTAPKDPRQLKKAEVKYFTESGIKFKLENGELYKKEWVDEPIEPYMDKVTDPKTGEEKEVEIIPDFRLVNKETGKPVKLSKYVLQQAVWKKLES